MALLTVSEFRSFSNINNVQIPDTQAQVLVEAASVSVIKYLGRRLEVDDYTEYYCGTGTKHLILRQRPVLEVTSVHYDPKGYYGSVSGSFDSTTLLVDGVDYTLVKDSHDTTVSKSGMLLRITGLWVEYPRRRESYRLSQDLVPNHGDVKVTYTAGYPTIPADVKLATCQFITKSLQYLRQGGPLLMEHLGDYSYKIMEYHLAKNPDMGSIRQILAPYREIPWWG